MKRRVLALMALVLCLGLIAFAADTKVDLSGTWTLDKGKSDPIRFGRGPGGPGGGSGQARGGGQAPDINVTLTIKQTENELSIARKITMNGQDRSVEQKFTLDGTENTNPAAMGRGEVKSKTNWKKDKLVTEGTQVISSPNGEFEMGIKEEFSLSEDGKVLTVKTTRSTPNGENDSKQVYNKQ